MPEGSDQALLDRVVTGLRDFVGQPGHRQIKSNAEWVRRQFDANPAMRQEYLQAAVMHPQLFQNDQATIVSNVEAVVAHFASDGLTREDYFRGPRRRPVLLRQKPSTVISNIETVMTPLRRRSDDATRVSPISRRPTRTVPHTAGRGFRRTRSGRRSP